jgi:hypothetical protein
MKKILVLLVALFSLTVVGQTESTKEKNMFVSAGVSISNGDFETYSYPSVELGYSKENISYSVVFGRGNFDGAFKSTDKIDQYWTELKFSPSYSVGNLSGFLVAGGGLYFNTDHYFAEIGLGTSYTHNNMVYGVMFTNWDTRNYVTPFVSLKF